MLAFHAISYSGATTGQTRVTALKVSSIEILGRLTGTNLPHRLAYHHAWAPLIRDSPRSKATLEIR